LTKGAHRIERLGALVEHAREALKDMRRIVPDVEPDATVALRQASSQTG
jgi:signal transduction histidine kinase